MPSPLYPIIDGMMTYLTKNGLHFCTLKERLPRYFGAIMDQIELAEARYRNGDKAGTEEHAKKAMGHFKKAKKLLEEKCQQL